MVIHQMGSVLCYGDAITNAIAALDRQLTAWGFATRIYGADIAAARMPKAELDTAYRSDNPDDLLIYHYSAYCDNYRLFQQSRQRKILVYHNITPAEFYRPYDPFMEAVCAQGRAVLPMLTECDLALGVSEYNRQELIEVGFDERRTGVLPILLDQDHFAATARDNRVYRRLTQSGWTNLLFVGRVAPNKAHQDVIKLFAAYQAVNPRSRLWLVGARFVGQYDAALDRLVARLGLQECVTFTDRVTLAELKAYYEAADAFVCASRHEGFCVPLLEAMYFGVPILARAETAIPSTLGDAGVLYHEPDYGVLAETLGVMIEDTGLRAQLIERQHQRLADFAPARVIDRLREALTQVGVPVPDPAMV